MFLIYTIIFKAFTWSHKKNNRLFLMAPVIHQCMLDHEFCEIPKFSALTMIKYYLTALPKVLYQSDTHHLSSYLPRICTLQWRQFLLDDSSRRCLRTQIGVQKKNGVFFPLMPVEMARGKFTKITTVWFWFFFYHFVMKMLSPVQVFCKMSLNAHNCKRLGLHRQV